MEQGKKKIENELALNKQKSNKGNIKQLRQLRKLAPAGDGRREKYPKAASHVLAEFKLRRARGRRISKLCLCKKMKMQVESCYGKEETQHFKASSNWFQRFKKRHNISLRTRTNTKKDAADMGRETLQRFHKELRKSLKSTRRRRKLQPDSKYGRWFPEHRHNPSAWMDEELNLQWVRMTLIPALESDNQEKVLFADHVGFQLSQQFHDICRSKINTVVYMLPANHTEKVQPIDAGCGMMMKKKIGEAMERQLEDETNLELWHDKLSGGRRRVLMTKWTGDDKIQPLTNYVF
eukprot:gene13396-14769_t